MPGLAILSCVPRKAYMEEHFTLVFSSVLFYKECFYNSKIPCP